MRFGLTVFNFLQFWICLVARLFRIWCFEFRIWLSRFVSNFGSFDKAQGWFRVSDLLLRFQPQNLVRGDWPMKALER
jgi:hypothetical protein